MFVLPGTMFLPNAGPAGTIIVLTDIRMPEMNGKEPVSKIRADERFAGLPAYAVSARRSPAERSNDPRFSIVCNPRRGGDSTPTICDPAYFSLKKSISVLS